MDPEETCAIRLGGCEILTGEAAIYFGWAVAFGLPTVAVSCGSWFFPRMTAAAALGLAAAASVCSIRCEERINDKTVSISQARAPGWFSLGTLAANTALWYDTANRAPDEFILVTSITAVVACVGTLLASGTVYYTPRTDPKKSE